MGDFVDSVDDATETAETSPDLESGFTERGNITRTRILQEAIAVFDKYGYNGATLLAGYLWLAVAGVTWLLVGVFIVLMLLIAFPELALYFLHVFRRIFHLIF